jgi:hypothetical protein
MRDFETRKAEIFRRSEKLINERKRRNKRIISLSASLCVVVLISATVYPKISNNLAPLDEELDTSYSSTVDKEPLLGSSLPSEELVSSPEYEPERDESESVVSESEKSETEVSESDKSESDKSESETSAIEEDTLCVYAKLTANGMEYLLTDKSEYNLLADKIEDLFYVQAEENESSLSDEDASVDNGEVPEIAPEENSVEEEIEYLPAYALTVYLSDGTEIRYVFYDDTIKDLNHNVKTKITPTDKDEILAFFAE